MKRLVLATLVACAACGGSGSSIPAKPGTSGQDQQSGSEGGSGTAVAFLAPATDCSAANLGSLSGLVIGVANRQIADACRVVADHCLDAKNVSSVNISIINQADPGPAATPPPGTYDLASLPEGIYLEAYFVVSDAACKKTPSQATAGTVTLDKVGPDTVAGSFDLTFEGKRVHGEFNAPVCGSTLSGVPICQFAVGEGGTCTGTKTCQ